MPDDRPVLTADEQLAQLQKDFDDFRSTALARLTTRPTGDIEPTFRSAPKTSALFCLGQTLNRVDYPVLWQWAQDQGIVGVTNLFGNGNGTTTFTLPNLAGRTPVGVGTLGSDTYALGDEGGTAFPSLSVANMPSHSHSVSVNGVGDHQHATSGGNHFTNFVGDHGGHTDAPNSTPAFAAGGGSLPTYYNAGKGGHNHTVDPGDFTGGHSHSVNQSGAGSGTAFDNRQPYFALNWMIYT